MSSENQIINFVYFLRSASICSLFYGIRIDKFFGIDNEELAGRSFDVQLVGYELIAVLMFSLMIGYMYSFFLYSFHDFLRMLLMLLMMVVVVVLLLLMYIFVSFTWNSSFVCVVAHKRTVLCLFVCFCICCVCECDQPIYRDTRKPHPTAKTTAVTATAGHIFGSCKRHEKKQII